MDKHSLTALAEEHIAAARNSSNGRSAVTVYGGHEHSLRQTLMALRAGSALAEHDSPGEATLYVLRGSVRLTVPGACSTGVAGDHLLVPPSRHSLDAIEDSAILLTVVKPIRSDPADG